MATRGRPRRFDRADALRRAMEVFWQRGYEGTAVSDLTAVMGINAPSLYAAFGSKEALFREAVELYDRDSPAERALREEPTARTAVAAMLRDSADAYTRPGQPRGCMIVLSAPTCAPENDDVRLYLAKSRQDARNALRRRLDRGVSDGDMPAGADTAALAAFYSTVFEGLSIEARDGASRKVLRGIADSAMTAWHLLVTLRTKG